MGSLDSNGFSAVLFQRHDTWHTDSQHNMLNRDTLGNNFYLAFITIMLSVIKLSVFMPSAIKLSVVSVIIVSVVMLKVVAPFF